MGEWSEQLGRAPRSISFMLCGMQRQRFLEQSGRIDFVTEQPMLIANTRGSLTVTVSHADRQENLHLHQGELVSLAPETAIVLAGAEESLAECYMLSYTVQSVGVPDGKNDVLPASALSTCLELFPHNTVWKVSSQRLSRSLDQLNQNRNSTDPLQQLANHMHVQECMMLILLERGLHTGKEQDRKKAVERAIDYMRTAYHENITVDKLASEARMSRRQFTDLFRKLTNSSVTDYLTELRIHHAKQLLLTGGHLSDISRMVGYRDEFYFNRRFKQTVGQSPRQYARNKHRQLQIATLHSTPERIVADQYMGQLLKLGIIPVGVRSNMLQPHFLADTQRHNSKLSEITDIGQGFPISLPLVSQLQPDLIVTQNERQYEQLKQIAPTILIPYASTDPLEKYSLLGKVLGKSDMAEQWIEDYKWRTEQARTQIQAKLGHDYSITNLLFLDGKLFVQGHYAGYGSFSMYRALQLPAPVLLRNELNEEKLSIEIPLSALPAYAGDYIFVSMYGDCSVLTKHELWQSLPAVRKGRAFFCNPYRFAFEDPYSLDDQLEIIKSRLLG